MARRFAIVSPNYYPRVCGVGDYSAHFGRELQRRGHEVKIFSRLPTSRNPMAPDLDVQGVAGSLPMVIAQRLAAAIRAYEPTDVLLQYTSQMWDAWRFGSPASIWLAQQARRAGAQVTLIAHELYLVFQSRPDLFIAAGLQHLQLAALLKSCDHTFVTTDTRAAPLRQVCRLLGVPETGVVRVGANALPVNPQPRAMAQDGVRLGIFSTAAVGRRFDVALDCFARIARERPAAELVLIGNLGPPDRPLVRQIVDTISRHPAKERIRMTGKLSLSEVANEIAKLDLYLFPANTGATTRSGTLPTALGSGVPTITVRAHETDVAVFRDGENIVFASELSGAAFAESALRLLGDPPLMARVSEGARRLYAEHLSWERIVERFLEAI